MIEDIALVIMFIALLLFGGYALWIAVMIAWKDDP